MSVNPFDKASRYAAKLDAAGLWQWLVGPRLAFRGWLDTRRLTFPDQPERTCDTVAHLVETSGQPWAVPLEFQLTPDPNMFGRALGYLGPLWLEHRPDPERGSRFHVAFVVVNLTGRGDASRDLKLPVMGGRHLPLKHGPRTCLLVGECDLATQDAGRLLRAVTRRRAARCLLVWIPLMHGGDDPDIIKQWRHLAGAEADDQRRADYGALALVFAEPAGRRNLWQPALQGWNMIQSQQVLEWQAEARIEASLKTQRQALRLLLEHRFGALPEEMLRRLEAVSDLGRLEAAFRQALDLERLEDLRLGDRE